MTNLVFGQDCRKRWFHSLGPLLRKGRWTKEDEILLVAYATLGPAWKGIGNESLTSISTSRFVID
jgi:hypothetical protein